MISAIEQRVRHYWTLRSHDFGVVRKNELDNDMGQRWLRELEMLLPKKNGLRILDVGTGTGFFAILLSEAGHQVEGIDLTPAMLDEARGVTAQRGLDIVFREMDAQALSYDDSSFDVLLSRNLTWTLPEPEKAYREWFRVLKPGVMEQRRRRRREDARHAEDDQAEIEANDRPVIPVDARHERLAEVAERDQLEQIL